MSTDQKETTGETNEASRDTAGTRRGGVCWGWWGCAGVCECVCVCGGWESAETGLGMSHPQSVVERDDDDAVARRRHEGVSWVRRPAADTVAATCGG